MIRYKPYIVIFIFIIIFIAVILLYKKPSNTGPFPQCIFQTWKNKTPPSNMAYWQNTWHMNHPGWTFDFWDDNENRKFIQTHYPWFLETYMSYDKEIKRADAVRYFYLYHFGGIYADMDFECLRNMEPLLKQYSSYDIIFGSIHSDGRAKQHILPNAIMISKPKCDFWLSVFKELQRSAKQSSYSVEEMTGPAMLKRAYDSYWFGSTRIIVLKPEVLYPISWITHQSMRKEALQETSFTQLTNKMKSQYPNSYAITYWTHSW